MGAILAEGASVVISGPAGIGKTSLARAALADGPHREAGALSSLAWVPLHVFGRLLRRDPPESPEAVAAAVLRQGVTPVLLDDAQWVDDASLEVLAVLVGRVPLVATLRTGESCSTHVADVLSLLGAADVPLAGLAREVAEPLVATLHPEMGPEERRRLVSVAEGNPLLLAELPGGDEGPPTLVSALLARVATLEPEPRAALVRLSVLGRPTGPEVLGPGAVALPATGLVVHVEAGLQVRHPLLAEVIVEGIGSEADDARRDVAGRVGEAEAAHLLATVGDRVEARRLALSAARTSDRRIRAEMLTLAVRCAPDLDPDLRLRAARLLTATSQPARARELCAAEGIEALGRVERGALRAAEAEAAWLQGRHEECFALQALALDDLRGTRSEAEVLVLAGSTVAQTFVDVDGRPALDRARAAVVLADEIGAGQGYARTRLASVLTTAGEPGWAEMYAEVIDRAEVDGERDLRRTAVMGLVLAHWINGDPGLAEEIARREVDAGPAQDHDLTWLSFAAYAALLGLQTGRSRPGMVEEFGPILDREPAFRSRPFMEGAVVLALADAGDHAAAAARVTGGMARAGTEPQWRAVAWWTVVETAWSAGRDDDACTAVADLLALGVGDYPAAVQARVVAGHAACALGRDLVGPAPAAVPPAWRAAQVEWAALDEAAAGRHGAASDGFVAAARAWAPSDRRSEVRCAWAAGDAAATAGLPTAVPLLEQAEQQAAALGFRALEARTRRSLRRAGSSRRSASAAGVGGLTLCEEQVLDLVGAGLTSRQVGAALGLTESTVSTALGSAARRLGVKGRVAAVARLQELRAGTEGLGAVSPP